MYVQVLLLAFKDTALREEWMNCSKSICNEKAATMERYHQFQAARQVRQKEPYTPTKRDLNCSKSIRNEKAATMERYHQFQAARQVRQKETYTPTKRDL